MSGITRDVHTITPETRFAATQFELFAAIHHHMNPVYYKRLVARRAPGHNITLGSDLLSEANMETVA
jgi:hypothetical protein